MGLNLKPDCISTNNFFRDASFIQTHVPIIFTALLLQLQLIFSNSRIAQHTARPVISGINDINVYVLSVCIIVYVVVFSLFSFSLFCCCDGAYGSLVDEGVCSVKNVPSISSINRISRDMSVLSRRLRTTASHLTSYDDVRTIHLTL